MIRFAACLLSLCALAACGGADESPSMRIEVAAAPAVVRPVDHHASKPALTPAVEDKIAEIRAILERNSLYRLARLAESEPAFVSNFANQSHRAHWDLLRRTGFDPLLQLGALLDGPYGIRQVGDETWYIWPDLAALSPRQLEPERLSFADRARLRDLVGDAGIQRIRDGQAYPGVRTAIAEDGRWLYYIHQTEDDAGGD